MCLLSQGNSFLKVLKVDVCVDPEEPLEDGLGHGHEVLGEGNFDFAGEQGLIVDLVLNPGHQVVNVLENKESLKLADRWLGSKYNEDLNSGNLNTGRIRSFTSVVSLFRRNGLNTGITGPVLYSNAICLCTIK